MINLIRGTIENNINKEIITQLDDYSFLVKNNLIELNTKTLTPSIVEKITAYAKENNIDVNFYFNNWTSLEGYLLNDSLVNIKINKEDIQKDIYTLNNLTELTENEKVSLLIKLAKTPEDFKQVNEAINKGTITLNDLLKRMVVKYE